MEQRSDRINVLLTDLDDQEQKRLKVALREIATETFRGGAGPDQPAETRSS
jgi:DNA-directed RNA polymerase subunit K/omega